MRGRNVHSTVCVSGDGGSAIARVAGVVGAGGNRNASVVSIAEGLGPSLEACKYVTVVAVVEGGGKLIITGIPLEPRMTGCLMLL